jgi:hypothetical protein
MTLLAQGIDYDRRPDPEWNRALARLAPRSEFLNWLHVDWFAGDPWDPVERWVVYEMTPWNTIASGQAMARQFGYEDEIYRDLTGPNPRTKGHFDHTLNRYVYDDLPPLIDRRQWVLFRRFRCYATPVWIVQGDRGGHKRHFTPMELRHLRSRGYPYDAAPAPGELPYAEFDERVITALAKLDHLRKWDRMMSWRKRTMADTFKARAAAETRWLELFGDWLDEQMAGVASVMQDAIAMGAIQGVSDVNDLPYRDVPVEEREQATVNFLTPSTAA